MRDEETEEDLSMGISRVGKVGKTLSWSPLARVGGIITQQALLGCLVPEENHLLPALLAQG